MPRREQVAHDRVDSHAVPALGEDGRPVSPHSRGVALHDAEVGAHVGREIGLVDDEEVALRDSRTALARHLVAPGDVDDVNRVIDELATELGGEVVAAALEKEQLRGLRPP